MTFLLWEDVECQLCLIMNLPMLHVMNQSHRGGRERARRNRESERESERERKNQAGSGWGWLGESGWERWVMGCRREGGAVKHFDISF